MQQDDWTEHVKTYRWFVRGVLLFAGHALIVLLILAWFFGGEMGAVAFAG
jgi:hypothetical protein